MQGFEEAAVLISTDGLGYQIEQRIEHKPDTAATDGSIEAQALAAVGIKGEKRATSSAAARHGGGLSDPYGGNGGGGGGSGLGSDPFEDLGMAAAAAAAGVSKKPLSLRDQLAANKAAQEEAWKEKHNPFKPPPGLDEEDYHRYEDLELARRSRHEQAREQDAHDFTLFQIALQQKEMAVRALNDAETPVGAAVPLPEPEKMLDPSLRFGPGAGANAAGAGAALLAPLSPASATTAASAFASTTTAAPGAASLPTLVLLKRKHSSEESHHNHNHSHGHNGAHNGAAGSTSSSKDGEKHPKKKKKHRKDKDAATTADSATPAATTAASAAVTPAPATAAAAEPAESGLAGLIGAYGSDDDE